MYYIGIFSTYLYNWNKGNIKSMNCLNKLKQLVKLIRLSIIILVAYLVVYALISDLKLYYES